LLLTDRRLLIAGGVITVLGVLLLFYSPSSYTTAPPSDTDCVDTYLTHELAPALYNGWQRAEPFELLLDEDKVNRAIRSGEWPKTHESMQFSAPVVDFADDKLTVMTTAAAKLLEFVVTIEIRPAVNEAGMLNVPVESIKIGAVDVTPLAKLTARNIYHSWTNRQQNAGPDGVEIDLIESLLNNRPFEGVFESAGRKLRVKDVRVRDKKMAIDLVRED